jgi:hypothetical protein
MPKHKEVEVDEVDDDEILDEIEEEDDEETVETVTASFIAGQLKVDPKMFRRFIRARVVADGGAVGVDTPGSGGRYAFPVDEVDEIMAAFKDWAAGPKKTKKEVIVEIDDEDYDEEDLEEEDFVVEDEGADEDEGDDAEDIEEVG